MKRLIQRWLGLPVPDHRQDLLTLSSNAGPRIDQDVKLRVELLEAVNGRVLQEYEYLSSEEQFIEDCECNDVTFYVDEEIEA